MIVGVPSETFPGERRVALVPGVLSSLSQTGLEVLVEEGAGRGAGFLDNAYVEKGARVIGDRSELFKSADVILQVRGLGANPKAGQADLEVMRPGQVVIALLEPLIALQEVKALAQSGVTAFAMELIPRISRAQNMDALSSMATVSGYKAVLLAASTLPRMFPMLMTAAGTITPAKVLVVGIGVAGLQAIATARRLGAVVHASDIRPAVKEQVESLGARFVPLPGEAQDTETVGGYAKEMGEEFYRQQRETMFKAVAESDVVITAAAVPGKKAPVLITEEMVKSMQAGSVIVDLAAERGGNCELTLPDETRNVNGVTIMGPTNLPSTVPHDSSQMYSKNVVNFLLHMVKEGALHLDMDNQIIRETLVTKNGELVHPVVRELSGLPTTPCNN